VESSSDAAIAVSRIPHPIVGMAVPARPDQAIPATSRAICHCAPGAADADADALAFAGAAAVA